MAVEPGQLILRAGGECLRRHGTLIKRTSRRDEVAATHSRNSVGWARTRSGILVPWEADVPRVTWVDTDGDGVADYAALLLELSRTNLCLHSEDFSGAAWSAVGTPTRTGGAHTAAGVSLDLIGDDDGGNTEGYEQSISFTGDAVKSVILILKEGASPGSTVGVRVRDTTAGVNQLEVNVSWSGGVPTSAFVTGSETRDPELLTDGAYRFCFQTASVTAANSHTVRVFPASSGAADTGDVYAGAVMVMDASAFPTSYIQTTTATVTRNADTFHVPFHHAPQAVTGYVKLIELGGEDTSSVQRVLHIGGSSPGDNPKLSLRNNGSGLILIDHNNGSASVTSTVDPGASIADLVEYRFVAYGDGSVQVFASVNEGAEMSGSRSSANAFGSAWALDRIYLNSGGTSQINLGQYIDAKVALGEHSLADMRAAL